MAVMSRYDVIISARDEAATVSDVVKAARRGDRAGLVIVVDDGSTDETAAIATAAGAIVISTHGAGDKARAMATGMRISTADVIVFFDADILHAAPAHFEALAGPVLDGPFQMCCGLVDYGRWRNPLFQRLPPITGLRSVRRAIFESIPDEKLNGFQIEIMINEVIARNHLPTAIRVLTGIDHRSKVSKMGFVRGVRSHISMTLQLLACFRFVPLWTYWSYLSTLVVLKPSGQAYDLSTGVNRQPPEEPGLVTEI
ncbi:MAG TPA: glycosyltransferase [Thermoanaerobaculia bacterium]|nr:glycosyltransferase [Thermoanaerobaculia bacterium]